MYVRLRCRAVFCIGSGLPTSWSLVQRCPTGCLYPLECVSHCDRDISRTRRPRTEFGCCPTTHVCMNIRTYRYTHNLVEKWVGHKQSGRVWICYDHSNSANKAYHFKVSSVSPHTPFYCLQNAVLYSKILLHSLISTRRPPKNVHWRTGTTALKASPLSATAVFPTRPLWRRPTTCNARH